jgi:hypothetical protein
MPRKAKNEPYQEMMKLRATTLFAPTRNVPIIKSNCVRPPHFKGWCGVPNVWISLYTNAGMSCPIMENDARICRHSSLSSDSISGQRAR